MKRFCTYILALCVIVSSCCRKDQPTVQPVEDKEEIEVYSGQQEDLGSHSELSEDEVNIQSVLPDREEDCPVTQYSEEKMLQLDSIALDFLERNNLLTKASNNLVNINRLEGYIVENIVWDAGDWGASHWAGDKIICGYNADYNNKGDKLIRIVLYREEGFQAGKAYLKLGTLNSGKPLCCIKVSAGQKYFVMEYNIDNTEILDGNKGTSVHLLPGYGILNLFPLLVYSNGYREYLNPILIKSDPIVPNGWDAKDHSRGYLFGTINGVPVFHNGNNTAAKHYNMSSGTYQCVELCKRYLTTHYSLNRTVSDIWGNANEWPDNRSNDKSDKYIVLKNDGTNQIREGDMIVFEYDDKETYKYGHIGVVIKTLNSGNQNYISYAHQNGGINNRPIGATNNRTGDLIQKKGSRSVTYFIRKDNVNEHASNTAYEEPNIEKNPSIAFSPDPLRFEPVTLGDYDVLSWTIKNTGTGTLVVSSITPPEGYRCNKSAFTVEPDKEQVVRVRFEPAKEGAYNGDCVLQTNLGSKTVRFEGDGVKPKSAIISINPTSLEFKDAIMIGETAELNVDIINSGDAQLDFYSISCPDGFSTSYDIWSNKMVRPNDHRYLKVYFSPTTAKTYGGKIVIKSNASNEPTLSFEVRGRGVQAVAGAVDLGLSVRWASYNLGASSPEEYGDYYAWGETSTKDHYSISNYKWWTSDFVSDLNNYKAASGKILKYNNGSKWGTVDNQMTLSSSDDAARVNLGAPWRMPTWDEMMELKYKCEWKWTSYKGVSGYRVTGPNGNWIFLTAAGGWIDGGISPIYPIGKRGLYWSSSLNEYVDTDNGREPYPVVANCLDLSQNGVIEMGGIRSCGYSIRPVCDL